MFENKRLSFPCSRWKCSQMLTKSTHTGEKENPYPGVGSLWGGMAFVLEFAVQSQASHFVTIAKRVSADTSEVSSDWKVFWFSCESKSYGAKMSVSNSFHTRVPTETTLQMWGQPQHSRFLSALFSLTTPAQPPAATQKTPSPPKRQTSVWRPLAPRNNNLPPFIPSLLYWKQCLVSSCFVTDISHMVCWTINHVNICFIF